MRLKKVLRFVAMGSALLVLGAACNGAGTGTPAATGTTGMALTGTVSQATFPAAVTTVKALVGTKTIAEAPIAADGTFALTLPKGTRYRLELAHGGGSTLLVFPRSAGTIGHTFDVLAAAGAFELGTVRFIGDPAGKSYHYLTSAPANAAASNSAAEETDGATDGDNVQCEDGIDPTTGAVCVDDDGGDATCEAGDGEKDGETADDADSVNCEDGIDPVTGLECDGGPSANADDGTEAGAEEDSATDTDNVDCQDGVDAATGLPCDNGPDAAETDEGDLPADGAVADHNLATAVGCDQKSEEKDSAADTDNVECEDGIDAVTGLPCDDGPDAGGEGDGEGK